MSSVTKEDRTVSSLKEKEASEQMQEEDEMAELLDNDDAPEDARCDVCNDGDFEDNNLIVFCDGCDIAVHQQCYGIDKVTCTLRE